MLDSAIAQYLNSHREEHLKKFFEFLRFPSIANVNDDPDSCRLCAQWLIDLFESIGMDAEILESPSKPNVLARLHVSDDAPTVLFYGHYDVQPADPLDQWNSPPFTPTVRDGAIYARGASDNKGSSFPFIMALEAFIKSSVSMPFNVKFFYEGEEEIGSPNAEEFLAEHGDKLAADICVVSDSLFFSDDLPAIVYAMRGLAYFQIDLKCADKDAHSGDLGGMLGNPVNALARMLAKMHDDNGRVTLEGFYDDVPEITDEEKQAWAQLPFAEAEVARMYGVTKLEGGEKGFSALERRWARPTLDCNGIVGGYTEPGAKTIIPAEASMKISMRLPPAMNPKKVEASLKKFVAENTPESMKSTVHVFSSAKPVMLKPPTEATEAMKAALAEAFGKTPAMIRMGATVPIVEVIQRRLGMDAVLMGFGLPGDGLHSPNERFKLDQFYNGSVAAAAFIQNYAESCGLGQKG